MRTRAAGNPAIDPRRVETVLRAVEHDLARRHATPALVAQVRQSVTRFVTWLATQGIRDLRAVTEAHVTRYARHLAQAISTRGRPYALATQRWHLACLQRVFRLLEAQGVVLYNPTLDLALPAAHRLPAAVVRQDQARRLLAHPDPRTPRGQRSRAVLELLYGVGLRVSECVRLDCADVSLGQGVLFVRDGKGRKDRVVPLVGRAAAALDVYLQAARPRLLRDPHEPALFLTRHGTRLRVKVVQALVRAYAKRAQIPAPLTPHQLRHACATHLLQGGADIRHVQQLLGHASLDTTAIYTRVSPVDLTRAVDAAHPRDRSPAAASTRRPLRRRPPGRRSRGGV